ncbi:GNAT family N-acetyltransferase [Duganella sp. BJB488]|uniref:L-ornithine N(alpha)-acyltransferase n=1 Tax=Duganella vulcania TaxID=2692166 RepID=A0A845HL77_9BURK|nr:MULTISPECIES: GNAT family N-acyltransferase [Duganella]MYN18285.1 GNAT family N-acetyltransferase [Duganella vulcania]RFP15233.1 GNAT family N-acetyltransferase [Duganella sp. BJB489]RFP19789.1 GNAT family N-acetyltransferase [Duganella sp. BJB488]RFP38176.1 GNAT family N-acetyltransferase [Duganella sp. BJB480]
MQTSIIQADVRAASGKLVLSMASTPEELREVQRLRYKVFIETMGLSSLVREDGLDSDEFDEHCDHLIVRDSSTLRVVGTYRLLSAARARKLGRVYSEGEFDLGRLNNLRGRMVEAGRACIHPDYRGGSVIMLLWSGLAEYMRRENCDYLAGCASISLADGGHNAVAVYQSLVGAHLAPSEYRVTPHLPFPFSKLEAAQKPQVPPLLKGYVRSGAWICGEPAWDPDFESADLFLLLPLANLDGRYARHYGVAGEPLAA